MKLHYEELHNLCYYNAKLKENEIGRVCSICGIRNVNIKF
jgi:hypothetical protein